VDESQDARAHLLFARLLILKCELDVPQRFFKWRRRDSKD